MSKLICNLCKEATELKKVRRLHRGKNMINKEWLIRFGFFLLGLTTGYILRGFY